jgi:DNA repair protein RadC
MPWRVVGAKHQCGCAKNPMWIKLWLTAAISDPSTHARAVPAFHYASMTSADQIAIPVRFRLRTAADAVTLFGEELRTAPVECLRLAHLDRGGALIALTGRSGGHDALPLSLNRIVREAFAHDSRRLLVAHNHPSGDPTPSHSDRIATRRLAELLRLLGIELVDHLVFARGGVSSFRQLGLL